MSDRDGGIARTPRQPGPETGSGICPRCGLASSFEAHEVAFTAASEGSWIAERDGSKTPKWCERVVIMVCRHCGNSTIVIEEMHVGGRHWREGQTGSVSWSPVHWWPLPDAEGSDDVPEDIAKCFAEAVTACHANCPRAAAVMARRTLEAVGVDHGETEGPLATRLDRMRDDGRLETALAEWAKDIRLVGNVGAHYDPIEHLDRTEVEELLRFMRELLRYVYELPAQLERRRSR